MAITRDEAQANNINVIDSGSILTDQKKALLEQVKKLLPSVVNSDNVVNSQALQDLFDLTNTTSNNQGYELTFAGKGIAKKKAETESNKQLAVDQKLSKNFDNTKNVIIKGDNLDALKILKKNYHNQIKMIYIDPPYSTEQTFIYPDNFRTNEAELINELGLAENTINYLSNILGTNTHSKWLSFMYPRLLLARDLLKDDGVIFISIDDKEQANLKVLCDEVFGEDNFINQIAIKMSHASGVKMSHIDKKLPKIKEYLFVYGVNKNKVRFNPVEIEGCWESSLSRYSRIIINKECPVHEWVFTSLNEHINQQINQNKIKPEDVEQFKIVNADLIFRTGVNDAIDKEYVRDRFTQVKSKQGIERICLNGEEVLFASKKVKQIDGRLTPTDKLGDLWTDIGINNLHKEGAINFPNGKKPLKLIKRLVEMLKENTDGIFLDFFAGSGTTAHAIMNLNKETKGNRKYIMVQIEEPIDKNHKDGKPLYEFCEENNLPTNISSITIERINRAGNKLIEENAELEGQLDIGYRVLTL
ncbi:MAG: adenine-specific DNA-methyltransferase, partial [Oleiphilaceae bacterium]